MAAVMDDDIDDLMSIPKLPFEFVDDTVPIFPPTLVQDTARRPVTHPEVGKLSTCPRAFVCALSMSSCVCCLCIALPVCFMLVL